MLHSNALLTQCVWLPTIKQFANVCPVSLEIQMIVTVVKLNASTNVAQARNVPNQRNVLRTPDQDCYNAGQHARTLNVARKLFA